MNKHLKHISVWIALIFILGQLGMASAPGTSPVFQAHPLLAHLAAEHPEQLVAVVVQKLSRSAELEDLALRLGGEITQDLRIINAFAARLPAGKALDLARHPAVRWVSLDAPVTKTLCADCIDTAYAEMPSSAAIGADQLWQAEQPLQGQGITVAVVDSGIAVHEDFKEYPDGRSPTRILARVETNTTTNNDSDQYGHGTHVAGIIAGNGFQSQGKYIGVAPKANLLNVKVSDDTGAALTSDVVAGLQWVYENKNTYNIRVVNLSINSTVAESYHTNPLTAALEILWFNGIVVVVSAGNNGNGGVLYPPANDPFVITVGAADDFSTADISDDALATYSAYGVTEGGFNKPELVAPGSNIIAALATTHAVIYKDHPENRVGKNGRDQYFRMSGTSMASAVATGAIALLLQDEPGLTPDQVKYRLMATARPFGNGSGAGYLDILAAVLGTTTESANTGITASQLLWTGSNPVTWDSVAWNSVAWNSVAWNSVAWNSVAWNSVAWNSDYWRP